MADLGHFFLLMGVGEGQVGGGGQSLLWGKMPPCPFLMLPLVKMYKGNYPSCKIFHLDQA